MSQADAVCVAHYTRCSVLDMNTTTTAAAPLAEGDRVTSEFGTGVVLDRTRRSLTYQLDAGGPPINVAVGTPGYFRVVREA